MSFTIIIKATYDPGLPGDYYDSIADDIEQQYGCIVHVELKQPRRKLTIEEKREQTRLRVQRHRAKQYVYKGKKRTKPYTKAIKKMIAKVKQTPQQ